MAVSSLIPALYNAACTTSYGMQTVDSISVLSKQFRFGDVSVAVINTQVCEHFENNKASALKSDYIKNTRDYICKHGPLYRITNNLRMREFYDFRENAGSLFLETFLRLLCGRT